MSFLFPPPRRMPTIRPDRRAGIVAISELVVMLIALAGIVLLGSQFMSAIAEGPGSSSHKSDACSDRCVYRMSLDHDGRRMWVFRPRDGIMQLDMATGETIQTLPLSGMELSAVAHSRDGSTSLVCGHDGTLVLHRDATAMVTRVNLKESVFVDAAVSADGSIAASATVHGHVHGWRRAGSESCEFDYELPRGAAIMQIGLNGPGRRMFVARIDGTVSFHATETGAADRDVLNVHGDARTGCEYVTFNWSDDERFLAVASSENVIRNYEIASGAVLCEAHLGSQQSAARPTCMAISPDGLKVALATNISEVIQIVDMKTSAVRSLRGHEGIVRALQFSPTSARLYSGSYDGTIREWNVAIGSQVRIID